MRRGCSLCIFLVYLEQDDGEGFRALWADGKCFLAHSPAWAARQARDEASGYGVPWTGERFSHPRVFVYLHVRDSLWKVLEGQPYPGLTPYRVSPSQQDVLSPQDVEKSEPPLMTPLVRVMAVKACAEWHDDEWRGAYELYAEENESWSERSALPPVDRRQLRLFE